MKRFIQSEDRSQSTLFPECPDDYIADNALRASSRYCFLAPPLFGKVAVSEAIKR